MSSGGFYGVYLLVSENSFFKGRTYIGFTVDPARRLRQHNRGSHAMGACRTSHRGPWSMVLIVHGFPNEISALRVEWAWQHPHSSRCLKDVPKKKASESRLQFSIRLLGCLLQRAPWKALPLTVSWLDSKYFLPFPVDCSLPGHMEVLFTTVSEVKTVAAPVEALAGKCSLCGQQRQADDTVTCGHEGCSLQSHVICLAQTLVTPSCPLLPVRGPCPLCARVLVWGERVRGLSAACASSRGHNRGRGVWEATDGHTREEETESEEDEGHWTNLLTQPS